MSARCGDGACDELIAVVVHMEQVARATVVECYFAALRLCCVAHESMLREHLVAATERAARERLACEMSADWVDSRQRQLANRARLAKARQRHEEVHDEYTAYLEWQQQRQHQLFLFAQGERQARMQLERQQRLHAGAIASLFAGAYREAHYRQRLFEQTRRRLDAAVCGVVTAQEVTQRTELLWQQHSQFDALRACEARAYLDAVHNEHVNTRVERQFAHVASVPPRMTTTSTADTMTVAADTLPHALHGIAAVRGAIVTCRDAAATEMLLRMNKSYTPSFVAAVLRNNDTTPPTDDADACRFFVQHANHVETAVRAWLNPFDSVERSSARAARRRQRRHEHTSHRNDDGEDDDDVDDDEDDDGDDDEDDIDSDASGMAMDDEDV